MGLLDAFGTTQALFNRLGATRLERSICGPQWFALSGLTGWPWSDPENLPDAGRSWCGEWTRVDLDPHVGTDPAGPEGQRCEAHRGRSLPQPTARDTPIVHLRPNPGTDGALALAVAHVIVSEGLERRRHTSRAHSTDVDDYRRGRRSVDARAGGGRDRRASRGHRRLRSTVCDAAPAAIRLGVGMQRSAGVGSALRAIQCLPASDRSVAVAGRRRSPERSRSGGRTWRRCRAQTSPPRNARSEHDPARPGPHRSHDGPRFALCMSGTATRRSSPPTSRRCSKGSNAKTCSRSSTTNS